ncbi:MAG: 50S ribosomal protein L32 [Candidatus Moranbacteria bacterium]|nr:50S ribosomal protein L32 [Candidatus Moranbacteria bacterium]
MPVQKQHHSKMRQKRGRVGLKVVLKNTQACPKCQAPVLSHTVCPKCGSYKGKEFVDTLKKATPKKK